MKIGDILTYKSYEGKILKGKILNINYSKEVVEVELYFISGIQKIMLVNFDEIIG